MRRRHPTHSDAASSNSAILKFIHTVQALYAAIAQLVEFQISNLVVAGSSPVCRSICGYTQVAEEVCLENT